MKQKTEFLYGGFCYGNQKLPRMFGPCKKVDSEKKINGYEGALTTGFGYDPEDFKNLVPGEKQDDKKEDNISLNYSDTFWAEYYDEKNAFLSQNCVQKSFAKSYNDKMQKIKTEKQNQH